MNTTTIALRRMILHLPIAEFRPKPVGPCIFLKNRQKQALRAALLKRVTFKCDMNLPSQSDVSEGGSHQHQSDPPFKFEPITAQHVNQAYQGTVRIKTPIGSLSSTPRPEVPLLCKDRRIWHFRHRYSNADEVEHMVVLFECSPTSSSRLPS
jgi:hypothetical protein